MKFSFFKLTTLFTIFILITLSLSCTKENNPVQQQDIKFLTFEKLIGSSNFSIGSSVCETSDGNYIIGGGAKDLELGVFDVYVVKTNDSGILVWEKTFGGVADDFCNSVTETSDGGFILGGKTWLASSSSYDVYLIKIDRNGILEWEKTFGGDADDICNSVTETSDGGFILTGITFSFGAGNSDVYFIKTDKDGNLVWEKTFGGAGVDEGHSVCETSDSGFIMVGITVLSGVGGNDVYMIKADKNGDFVWQRTFGGTEDDIGNAVFETTDKGFIITGCTESYGAGHEDYYLIKTDSSGTLSWEKSFGGIFSDKGNSVCETSDGGFIITGTTESFGGSSLNVYLVKTDNSGILTWTKVFGGTGQDGGNSVSETSDGGFVVTGYTVLVDTYAVKVYLIKTDSEGNVE